MSAYPPPTEDLPTFNPAVFFVDETGITLGEADARYVKLSGSIMTGNLAVPSITLNGSDVETDITALQTKTTDQSFSSSTTSFSGSVKSTGGDIFISGANKFIGVDNGVSSIKIKNSSNSGNIETVNPDNTLQFLIGGSNIFKMTNAQNLFYQPLKANTSIDIGDATTRFNTIYASTLNLPTISDVASSITSNATNMTTLQTKTTGISYDSGTTTTNITGKLATSDDITINQSNIEFLRADGSVAGFINYQNEGLTLGENRGGDNTSVVLGGEDIVFKTNNTTRMTIAEAGTTTLTGTLALPSNSDVDTQLTTNTSNIATNTSNISTNTSNISTNTSNIATNTTKLTGISYSSGEDETDIDTNSGNFKLSIQNKGIKIEGDPATTDSNDVIPLQAQTKGGSIQIRMLNRLGTGDSQNYHLYTNNFQRNASGFSIINTSYKAQKFEVFQPAIGNSNDSSVAYKWAFYSTTGSNPSTSAEILAYYDGRFQAPTLRTDEIDEINGNTLTISSQLDVNGFAAGSFTGAQYDSNNPPATGTFGGNYGALIIGNCEAGSFIASSSKKIKNIESSLSDISTQNEAIQLFESIPLSKYSYIDKVKNRSDKHYGLIAEEMPNNIFRYESNGYIPNIYQKGKVSFDETNKKHTITFNNPLDFSKFENEDMSNIMCFMFKKDNCENEEIEINEEGKEKHKKFTKCKINLSNCEIIDQYNIRGSLDIDKFCCGHQDKIFVYGVKGTIPSVKKEAYFELTSCVVKHLLKENKELKERLNKIEQVLNIN